MATLWRRSNSKYWTACFTAADGRQLKRSTKQTDRKKAQAVADEYETVSRERRSEDQVRRVIADLYEKTTGRKLEFTTARKFLDRWLAEKEREVAKATTQKYRQVVGAFVDSLGGIADGDMNHITVDHIRHFRDSTANSLSPATSNVNLKCVRAFLTAAWRESIVTQNVASKIPILKTDKSSTRRGFRVDELKLILDAAGDSEWRGMILFGLYTGQRLGDIASLRWNRIDGLGSDQAQVRFTTRKTGRDMNLPLAAPLARYLVEECEAGDDPNGPVFPKCSLTMENEARASSLSQGFRRVLVSAGLADPRSKQATGKGRSERRQTSELSFHSLRHTATSLLKSAGVSAAVAMDIVGHDSAAISAHYTHIEDAPKRVALGLLPDITAMEVDK